MVWKAFMPSVSNLSDDLEGNFDDAEKVWLVIWELDIIIQIPAGVFVLYPSSIFYHFNVDKAGEAI